MTHSQEHARRQAEYESEDAELIEIPSEAFIKILSLRPEIPEILSKLAADRAAQNKTAYETLKAMKTVDIPETLGRDGILRRFMRLLGRNP